MWANSLRKEESLRREYAAVTATATQSKRDAQEAFRKEFISPTGFTFIMNLPFSRRNHQTPKTNIAFLDSRIPHVFPLGMGRVVKKKIWVNPMRLMNSKEWAGKKFHEREAKRTKTTKHTESDGWSAKYHSFSWMVREEGGDPSSFAACVNYVTAAAVLQKKGVLFKGRPWSRWHAMKKRVEWLWVEEEFRGDLSRIWESAIEEETASIQGQEQRAIADGQPNPAPLMDKVRNKLPVTDPEDPEPPVTPIKPAAKPKATAKAKAKGKPENLAKNRLPVLVARPRTKSSKGIGNS